MNRYLRNRLYINKEEQQAIKNTKILLGGAGIGSIIAECSLRLGFENITIVDGDKVEESNLNRQNYTMSDIGSHKAEALADRLKHINPNANIKTINRFIDNTNVKSIIAGHDIAINALDFASDIPFVFDEQCKEMDIPVIHPYNIGWGGLAIVVAPDGMQIKEIASGNLPFEAQIVNHIKDQKDISPNTKQWIEKILSEFVEEKQTLPPPQLPIASWLVGGMTTHIMFNLATGKPVKYFPEFYFASNSQSY